MLSLPAKPAWIPLFFDVGKQGTIYGGKYEITPTEPQLPNTTNESN